MTDERMIEMNEPVTPDLGNLTDDRRADDQAEAAYADYTTPVECVHCGLVEAGRDHWERCQNHPAKTVITALRASNQALREALERWVRRFEGGDERDIDLYNDSRAALAADARREGLDG